MFTVHHLFIFNPPSGTSLLLLLYISCLAKNQLALIIVWLKVLTVNFHHSIFFAKIQSCVPKHINCFVQILVKSQSEILMMSFVLVLEWVIICL